MIGLGLSIGIVGAYFGQDQQLPANVLLADETVASADRLAAQSPNTEPTEKRAGVTKLLSELFTSGDEEVAQHADSATRHARIGAPVRTNLSGTEIAEAQAKMSAPVVALARAGGPEAVDLIVKYDSNPELFEADRVESLGGVVTRDYKSLKMRAISVPAKALAALAIDEAVQGLSLDAEIRGLSSAAHQTVNLPSLGTPNGAFTGSGVGVAVVDSGVGMHEDLPGVERVHLIAPQTVQPQGSRHDDALQALYIFDDRGPRLFDRAASFVPAAQDVDLDVESAAGVTWHSDKLELQSPNRISSPSGAQGIFSACTASNAITVEAWVRPGNVTQGGPARIVTYSLNSSVRNFTLAQDGGRYEFRLRTTTNGANGISTVLKKRFRIRAVCAAACRCRARCPGQRVAISRRRSGRQRNHRRQLLELGFQLRIRPRQRVQYNADQHRT